MPAVAQHLGMLTHLKAWHAVSTGQVYAGIDTLWSDEKDREGKTHPSCLSTPRLEADPMYAKCS